MDIYISMVKVIFILFGIVAGMVLLYRYAGRFAGKFKLNLRAGETKYNLKKSDSIYLGYKKQVSVVEAGDYVLVVGVGEKDMTLLAKWKKADKDA